MDQITNIRYHILVSTNEVLTKDDIKLLQTRKGARLNSFTTILKNVELQSIPERTVIISQFFRKDQSAP